MILMVYNYVHTCLCANVLKTQETPLQCKHPNTYANVRYADPLCTSMETYCVNICIVVDSCTHEFSMLIRPTVTEGRDSK